MELSLHFYRNFIAS